MIPYAHPNTEKLVALYEVSPPLTMRIDMLP